MEESDIEEKNGGDILDVISAASAKVPWKIAFFLFIFYILINNNIFIEHFLRPVPGSTKDGAVTSFGTVIIGLLLSIIYISLYFLTSANVI